MSRTILRGRIKHYIKERGLTAILVTHDQTEAKANRPITTLTMMSACMNKSMKFSPLVAPDGLETDGILYSIAYGRPHDESPDPPPNCRFKLTLPEKFELFYGKDIKFTHHGEFSGDL